MPAPPLNRKQTAILERIRDQLDIEFKKKGKGTKAQIYANLGINNTTVVKAFNSGSLRVGMLLQILDLISVPVEDFLCSVFGLQRGADPALEMIQQDLEKGGSTKKPRGLVLAEQRWGKLGEGDKGK